MNSLPPEISRLSDNIPFEKVHLFLLLSRAPKEVWIILSIPLGTPSRILI